MPTRPAPSATVPARVQGEPPPPWRSVDSPCEQGEAREARGRRRDADSERLRTAPPAPRRTGIERSGEVRAPVLPLGLARGPLRAQRARPLRRRARPLQPRPQAHAREGEGARLQPAVRG